MGKGVNLAGRKVTVTPRMQRLFAFWVGLRSSLWFVPTFVVLGSMALAHALVEAGNNITALSQQKLPNIFGFSAEGSREMLSAIATSMITVAGVAFSITIVALSLASSQYSPRVLRQFMRNRANQWVLGVFVGVFAFCLTVLPRVRGGDEAGFVPALAVAAGVVYALIGVGCLIFFIHHVATSIQASAIVAEIAAETRMAADEVFPESIDEEKAMPADLETGPWHSIAVAESGYIQLVGEADLVRIAAKHDGVIRMEQRVGAFVVAGMPIVSFSGAALADEEACKAEVLGEFTINRARTIEQDVMFGVRQIVDVALRALSPSLNDPTTANLCINYLTTILHPLATRAMGNRCRRHEGTVRLVTCEPTFVSLLAAAFGEIRANAASHPLVLRSILEGIERLAGVTRDGERRAALATEGEHVRALLQSNTCDPAAGTICVQAERILARLRNRESP